MISMIVVIDQNNGIGYNSKLLCHLPNDLKYFKRVTSGHAVIMGRRTYESLPVKPLPGRKNVVISQSLTDAPECILASSVEEALSQCDNMEESFVIGGAQVYQQMMPYAEKLYITRIGHRFDADAYFPEIDSEQWFLQSSEPHETDEKHPYPYSFEVYLKK